MEETRGSSSSPDPLEYPGDPKFLLSSATKSIPRRVSVSPRKSQSPQRRSQSPQKNNAIKPLNFSDVVLPSTPSGKGRGRDSVSPSKATMQSEGNVSPWRIRVTVEAEREEEEENIANGVQRAVGAGAMNGGAITTKVPLKGGESSAEPTPKRRKTPGRKSAVSERVPTPRRGKARQQAGKASPGNTPKRGPGRPRKSLQSIDPNMDTPKATRPESHVVPTPHNEDPFLDFAMDKGVPEGLSADNFNNAPLERTGDGAAPGNWDAIQGTPVAPEERGNDQENGSIRQSSPMSQRRDAPTPENTLHAGHTPRPQSRLYPSPTPSSLVEGDGAESRSHISPRVRGRAPPHSATRRLKDPTAEHREFDSIVEGEGFSMVSLSTLPSAKQQLNSATKAGLDAVSEVSPASQKSQDRSRIDERPAMLESSPQPVTEPDQSHAYPFTVEVPHGTEQAAERNSLMNEPQADNFAENTQSPQRQQPPAISKPKRKHLTRVLRVVRIGIALRGMFNSRLETSRTRNSYPSPPHRRNNETEAVRQRLGNLFGDFDNDTQRLLSAGLRFGNELAINWEAGEQQQEEDRIAFPDGNVNDDSALSSELDPPPKITSESNVSPDQRTPTPENNSGDTLEERMKVEMARRQAEWQRERESISRQIEAANSSRIIVIDDDEDDDDNGADAVDRMEETADDRREGQHEDQEEYDEGDGIHAGEEQFEGDDDVRADESYEEEEEDIWQQEAQQLAETPQEETTPPKPRRLPRFEIEEYVDHAQPARGAETSVLAAGKTQMARYRDGDFEFSSFLGTPESATRRFYQDNSASSDKPAPPPQDGLQSAGFQRSPASSLNAEVQDEEIPSSPPLEKHKAAHDSHGPSARLSHAYPAEDDGDDEMHVDDEYLRIGDEAAHGNYHDSPVVYDSESDRSPLVDGQDDEVANEVQHHSITGATGLRTQPESKVVQSGRSRAPPSQTQQVKVVNESHGLEPPSSWFARLTDIAPSWLTSRIAQSFGSENTEARSQREPSLTQGNMNSSTLPRQYVHHSTQVSLPLSPNPSSKPTTRKKAFHHKALALGGYFTDDHFEALSHLYHKAKKHPERFPYKPTPEREEMLGKWLHTPDGQYPRRITEFQLAIVDRFRKDLVEATRRRGGSDKLEYTELDIAWRLWSIIIGKKIRRERKLANRVGVS